MFLSKIQEYYFVPKFLFRFKTCQIWDFPFIYKKNVRLIDSVHWLTLFTRLPFLLPRSRRTQFPRNCIRSSISTTTSFAQGTPSLNVIRHFLRILNFHGSQSPLWHTFRETVVHNWTNSWLSSGHTDVMSLRSLPSYPRGAVFLLRSGTSCINL